MATYDTNKSKSQILLEDSIYEYERNKRIRRNVIITLYLIVTLTFLILGAIV